MSPVWTKEYTNEYGLVYSKSIYANYAITMVTVGVQLFMNSYALIVFFETPTERRQGRALYLISGWLIFIFYTLGACSDMVRVFHALLDVSDGIGYLNTVANPTWLDVCNLTSILLVFVLGDGLLLYRCYLLLNGGWMWLLALPTLTYLSVIALSIYSAAIFLESETAALSRSGVSLDILAFATNPLITGIICYRLLSSHRGLTQAMPLAGKRLAVYGTVVRVLVESALPLSIAGVINAATGLIPLSTSKNNITGYDGDPKALTVAHQSVALVYYALQALAPQMIIFRVTTARSWTRTDKSSKAEVFSQSLAFNHGPPQPNESQLSDQLTSNRQGLAEERRPDPEVTPTVRFTEHF
ncbi:hypothetical protein FA15DRAFT_708893 [Coprinopsis marcescibilis]|uniref:Uncharacterized protein n=1 Tax=Coprinopsis marcescibilis TaxID=230819 RepID=A0A5C3KH44_COPMA|nr:hypothetical protein FA15DRAFT_708893 [Coprinopsis marcescibilis]